jgi:transcriptional regulator with XRE-family HTH domain
MNAITDRLKILMGDLSARKFAEQLGYSATTVHEYLKGRTPPSDFVVRVCEHFEVDAWWLLKGELEEARGEVVMVPGNHDAMIPKHLHIEHDRPKSMVKEHIVSYNYDELIERTLCIMKTLDKEEKKRILEYAEREKLLADLLAEKSSQKPK